MIIFDGHVLITNPSGNIVQEQIEQLSYLESNRLLIYRSPDHLTENKELITYKIGFLMEFLTTIYPDEKLHDIYEILNKHYDVFLSRRQIERHRKEYLREDK